MSYPILLYDGVCGLCNRLVQFVLRRDREGVFRFAALQSGLAGRVLARHGIRVGELDTVYVAVNFELADEYLLARSDAVIFVLRQLGAAELRLAGQPGAAVTTQPIPRPTPVYRPPEARRLWLWRFLGGLLALVPRALREWGYRIIARNRYRIFGRYESCLLPVENQRDRFLDV